MGMSFWWEELKSGIGIGDSEEANLAVETVVVGSDDVLS